MMKVKTPVKTQLVGYGLPIRILICGSRDWQDIDTINKQLLKLIVERGVRNSDVFVFAGGASGADEMAKVICRDELGIAFAEFPAPWEFFAKNGNKRAAGPVRNGWQLRWGMPDACLAFHPFIVNSRGTKHMVELCRKALVPIIRVIDKEIKP